MQCRYQGRFRQCGNDAIREGLCDKHARECGKDMCSNVTDRKYCDAHECVSAGCDLPRFGYGDSCSKHGCALPIASDGMTAACGNTRKVGSVYCTEHACSSGECKEPRGTSGEYCYTHGCTHKLDQKHCGARRKRNSYACENHACASSDCGSESSKDSKYCQKHMCSDTDCGNVRADGSKFCAKHCCHTNGCTLASGTDGPYCLWHGCIATVQGRHCGQQQEYGSDYCTYHTCAKCDKPRYGDSECCEEHGCVHASDRTACRAAKKDGSDYCADHSCVVKGCGERRAGAKCCQRHGCKYRDGGSEPCGILKKSGSDYCADHSCAYLRCGRVRKVGECCKKHVCAYASGGTTCDAVRRDGSDYCRNHACAEGTCGMPKIGYGGRCDRHGCSSYVAGPESAACGAPKNKKSRWCALHECKYAGCKKSNDGMGSCCYEHGCTYRFTDMDNRFCMEPKKGGNARCDSHMCAICGNDTYYRNSRHCDLHTCTHKDDRERCPNPKMSGMNVCGTHAVETVHAPRGHGAVGHSVTSLQYGQAAPAFGTREHRISELTRKLKENSLDAVEVIDNTDLSWDDVVGADEAKRAIRQSIIQPYLKPELYPEGWSNGILLYGPPGTGKTLLIIATINEVNGVFLNVEAASVLDKWIGESEKKISALFKISHEHEKKHGKPVIIFIDEVDALLGEANPIHKWEVTTRNQFLTAMSGTTGKGKKSFVYVIGATNQPWNLGIGFKRRFQKHIHVRMPGKDARKKLFELYTKKLKIANDVDFDMLARNSPEYSCSDIKEICKGAQDRIIDEIFESDPDEKRADNAEKPRGITMGDFLKSMREKKPTVSSDLVQKYEKWGR